MQSTRTYWLTLAVAMAVTLTGISQAQADNDRSHNRYGHSGNAYYGNASFKGSAHKKGSAYKHNKSYKKHTPQQTARQWDRREQLRDEQNRIEALQRAQLRERARLQTLRAQRKREQARLNATRKAYHRADARFEARHRDILRDMVSARGNYRNTLSARDRAVLRSYNNLPRGIQKRLLAGKPLPPGIANQVYYLPATTNQYLGYPNNYRVGAYGSNYFLYNNNTGTVVDILQNLLSGYAY